MGSQGVLAKFVFVRSGTSWYLTNSTASSKGEDATPQAQLAYKEASQPSRPHHSPFYSPTSMDRDTVSQCATIADVERFANNILNDSSDAIARRLQLPRFETSFVADSDVLRELSVWKVLYRLRDTVDRFYIEQGRRNRTSPSDHRSQTHLEAFKKAFEEINDACDRPFGRGRVHNFLDMGFAPGGFTTWLLHANPDAKGVGVTLPPEASRIRSQVDPQFHPRFRIHHDDVIRLASRETTIGQYMHLLVT